MRRRLFGISFAAAASVLGCPLTDDYELEPSAKVACDAAQKPCGGACVSIDDPRFGCSPSSCEPCAIDHAEAICAAGACAFDRCDEGWGDCDGDPGCETDVTSSVESCGACGRSCDDGLFCTTGEACTDELCVTPKARDCDDGDFCTGTEACDEDRDSCASAGDPCIDEFACTVDSCDPAGRSCTNAPDETKCAATEVCAPETYASTATGCGPVPAGLSVACPPAATTNGAPQCTLSLQNGAMQGIAGQAAFLSCTTTTGPWEMFADDFDDGSLDAPWQIVSGLATVDGAPGSPAAWAKGASWHAKATLAAAGVSSACVDFDVAQDAANAGESIVWEVAFDAAPPAPVFALAFDTWDAPGVTKKFNRNVCVPVPAGATTVTWGLKLTAGDHGVWIDDVAFTGIGAPWVLLLDDPADDTAAWTISGGSGPYTASLGGSSALFAEDEAFTATSAPLDASSCDVVDLDFDFGFQGTLDAGEQVTMLVSTSGSPLSPIETLDLGPGVWDVDKLLLPWLGLRRLASPAANASDLVVQLSLAADDPGDQVWVDDVKVRCSNLPTPTFGQVTDVGNGSYAIAVEMPVPATVVVTCTWSTPQDAPLVASDTVSFSPP